MKRQTILKRGALALSFALGTALAQNSAFTTIDFPGATSTSAWGVNNRGDTVGLYTLADKTNHGFLFSGGRLTSIDFPGATGTDTYGINSKGDIVGDYTAGGVLHGFTLTQGRYMTVDVPGAATTALAAINPSGSIVAFYTLADNSAHTALISGNNFTPIEYPGASFTSANGLNARGDIVGNYMIAGVTHAFLLKNGKFTSIDVPGAAFTGAYGIDQAGNIVGRTRDAAGLTHGFVYSGGVFTAIDIPGATLTSAAAISSAGDIVGRYTAAGVNHAFVVSNPTTSYSLTDLGTLPGGTFSQPSLLREDGVITGVAAASDGTQHSVIWQYGQIVDIGSLGTGGPNNGIFGLNVKGVAAGQSETGLSDPNGEDFCGYGTHLQCLAYVWQNGAVTLLPTLGGTSATVGPINKHGQVVGTAETATRDAQCSAPQVLDYEAVIWGPKLGQIHELRPLAGDTVGLAFALNDNGQAIGATGTCATLSLPPLAGGPHAVLWEKNGTAVDLGNFGGLGDPSVPGLVNMALAINNAGQVAGAAVLKGNQANHSFLWTKEKGMKDLGTLPGDVKSAGLGINERGEVVGSSFGAAGPFEGNPRAYLWRNGVMADLNGLVPADSPLYLLVASGINSHGQIVGFGVTEEGDIHAFLMSPREGTTADESRATPKAPALSDVSRKLLQRNTRFVSPVTH